MKNRKPNKMPVEARRGTQMMSSKVEGSPKTAPRGELAALHVMSREYIPYSEQPSTSTKHLSNTVILTRSAGSTLLDADV